MDPILTVFFFFFFFFLFIALYSADPDRARVPDDRAAADGVAVGVPHMRVRKQHGSAAGGGVQPVCPEGAVEWLGIFFFKEKKNARFFFFFFLFFVSVCLRVQSCRSRKNTNLSISIALPLQIGVLYKIKPMLIISNN
jgi:hypothetical protein